MIVRWTESALADLQLIEAGFVRHSPQYARAMVERIFARSESLATHPRIGPIVPEYDDPLVRELFVDPFRVVYRVADDRVDVVAIVHAARRLPRDL